MHVEQSIVVVGDNPARAVVRTGTTSQAAQLRSNSTAVVVVSAARRSSSSLPTTFYDDSSKYSASATLDLSRWRSRHDATDTNTTLQAAFSAAPDRRKGLYVDTYA